MRQRRPSANWKLQRVCDLGVRTVVRDFVRFMCVLDSFLNCGLRPFRSLGQVEWAADLVGRDP